MSNMILSEWPRSNAGRRGPRPQFDYCLDGQIHVLPKPLAYKNIHSFRKAMMNRAYVKGLKLETCTDAAHPGALIVRCVGPIEDEG